MDDYIFVQNLGNSDDSQHRDDDSVFVVEDEDGEWELTPSFAFVDIAGKKILCQGMVRRNPSGSVAMIKYKPIETMPCDILGVQHVD